MKRFPLACGCWLALALAARAQTVSLPAELKAMPGQLCAVTATTDGPGNVVWLTPDAGLSVIDGGFFGGDSKKALVQAVQPGTYRLWALCAKGDKVSPRAECVVTVGTPTPPTPPQPPTPPAPADPLTAALQAAYLQDADPDRQASLAFLQSAFAGMAAQAGQWSDCQTNAAFAAKMRSVVEAPGVGLADKTKVRNLRSAIAAEVAKAWGASVAPLTPADAAKEIARIAEALKGVE